MYNSTSLVFRVIQIETTNIYRFKSTRMAVIKIQRVTSVGEPVEKLECSSVDGGYVKSNTRVEN